jgi:CopG family nickel-responsive transcriptional regulator
MTVKRFGVSLKEDISYKLDKIVKQERFPNRSRAISYLINEHQNKNDFAENDILTGAVIIIYDHNKTELHSKIKSLQHEYSCLILSAQHIHLDKNSCIETINVKGSAAKVLKVANKLKAIKEIKFGDFALVKIA